MFCTFPHEALIYGVEALASDAVDGVFSFSIEEENTGKKLAEIKQNLAETEKSGLGGSFRLTFPAPVRLSAGKGYKTAGNFTYLLIEGGKEELPRETGSKVRRDCPNVPY